MHELLDEMKVANEITRAVRERENLLEERLVSFPFLLVSLH